MHACTHVHCEFKAPGPRLERQSTTWEFSDIAITLTAGPKGPQILYGQPCGLSPRPGGLETHQACVHACPKS